MKEKLSIAYALLYDIETSLKSTTAQSMPVHYGPYWRTHFHESINLNKCYLHELLTILFRYPKAFPSYQNHKAKLHILINIRNKICHMQPLQDSEFLILKECHTLILSDSPILS